MYLTPSHPPARYTTPPSVSWTIDPEVATLTSVVNGIPPAISQYIAYDDLDPPSPFLATTQDGNGNVVYDGGFPKMYNSRLSGNTGDDFEGLYPSLKFLHNALLFTAKAGVPKRLLALNDRNGGSYSFQGNLSNGFRRTIEHVASVAGFTVTFKDLNDYPDQIIDERLTTLREYACVLVMATGNGEITQRSISDFVTYRQQGYGLTFVTDHGNDLTSLEDARDNSVGFFPLANKIMVNFGAYFTGNVNRQPVNVGFIRATYGDHPLYNGMLDTDDILAGGSESKVVVTEVETYDPSQQPETVLGDNGYQLVRFLMILSDGSVKTEQFMYVVGDDDIVGFAHSGQDAAGADDLTQLYRYPYVDLRTLDASLGTLSGTLSVDEVEVGTFMAGEVTHVDWHDVPPEITGVHTFHYTIDSPFIYTYTGTVQRSRPSEAALTTPAGLQAFLSTPGIDMSLSEWSATVRRYLTMFYPTLPPPTTLAAAVSVLRDDL